MYGMSNSLSSVLYLILCVPPGSNIAQIQLQFVYICVFFLAAESATYSHVKNAVKVFKEIGVSVP